MFTELTGVETLTHFGKLTLVYPIIFEDIHSYMSRLLSFIRRVLSLMILLSNGFGLREPPRACDWNSTFV